MQKVLQGQLGISTPPGEVFGVPVPPMELLNIEAGNLEDAQFKQQLQYNVLSLRLFGLELLQSGQHLRSDIEDMIPQSWQPDQIAAFVIGQGACIVTSVNVGGLAARFSQIRQASDTHQKAADTQLSAFDTVKTGLHKQNSQVYGKEASDYCLAVHHS